jgi:paired amphipathic helix protein Sin3a
MLYSRLGKIKALSMEMYENPAINPVAVELGLRDGNNEVRFNAEDRYSDIICNLWELVDGNMDTTEFEDRAREMFGVYGYISFTIKEIAARIGKEVCICVLWIDYRVHGR